MTRLKKVPSMAKTGDNEGNVDNDRSKKKKAEKAAKKKVIRPKKIKAKYTKKNRWIQACGYACGDVGKADISM